MVILLSILVTSCEQVQRKWSSLAREHVISVNWISQSVIRSIMMMRTVNCLLSSTAGNSSADWFNSLLRLAHHSITDPFSWLPALLKLPRASFVNNPFIYCVPYLYLTIILLTGASTIWNSPLAIYEARSTDVLAFTKSTRFPSYVHEPKWRSHFWSSNGKNLISMAQRLRRIVGAYLRKQENK